MPAPNPALVTTSDNCGGTVTVSLLSNTIANQTCANRFTITRVYRAMDACGNSSTCAQVITVFDNTAPVFSGVPANITVDCYIVPAPATPTASDNCGGVVTITFNEVQTAGTCPTLYTLRRTWVATDVCGNTSSAVQIITVIDTHAPQFLSPPVDVMVECDLETNLDDYQDWLDNHGGAVAEDCSEITWTYMDSPGHYCPSTCGGTFQHFIRFIATDECGNSSYHDAWFIVVDQTPPTFLVEPQSVVHECEGDGGEIYYYKWLDDLAGLEVVDNCGEVQLEHLLWSEKDLCGGGWSKTIQFRATDQCGNVSIRYATFIYADTTPPEVECASGDVLLQCEFDIPAPDPSSVITWDACSPVNVTLFKVEVWGGSGCQSAMTKTYTYEAKDACGNASYCYQSFMAVDSLAPVYTGADTIAVQCIDDLPDAEQAIDLIQPFVVDNCYDIICFNDGVGTPGDSSITFCFKAKDLCANWGEPFCVTFVATGGCKPLCTAGVMGWGEAGGTIDQFNTAQVVANLMNQYGPITVGRGVRTVTVSNADCVFELLPGTGEISELGIGNYIASVDNGCSLPSELTNVDGSLSNWVVSQTMALQLNIWYNRSYNGRELDYQLLSELPSCIIEPKVMALLNNPNATVNDLLVLANNYLGSWGSYDPGVGEALGNSLSALNRYWENCQENDPCNRIIRERGIKIDEISNLKLVPNPATNTTTLFFESESDGASNLQISDGRGVQSVRNIQVIKGLNQFELDLTNLPAGVYHLTLQSESRVKTLRLVKVGE